MSFSSFIRSSSLEGIERVLVEGVSPLDQFGKLQSQIAALANPALGHLFCEPLISEGNGAASTTVSWYAAYEGEATPITALEPGARKSAEALLRARIDALQPVIAAAPDGQLIAASLYMREVSDVFVIAGEPVLTNWGLVPEGAQASGAKRNAAFAAGLGAFGLALSAPPLAASEFADWRERLPGGADADDMTKPDVTEEAAADAAPIPVVAAVVTGELPWYRRAWAPALVAVVLAALVLLILLIPGVLLTPPPTAVTRINDQARLLEDSNRALEERLEQLRNARDTGICTADGSFEPSLPPATSGDEADVAPDETNPASAPPVVPEESLLPPPLNDLNVPAAETGASDDASLLDVVDQATVLVLALGDGQMGIGSGFFVAPGLVVTNDHVIAEGQSGGLFVTSETLGQVVPVEIVARTGTSPDSKVDFALLRGDFGDQRTLEISDQAIRLSHVVAAGFPLVVASEDARFRRLVEQNDPTAAPSTSTTRGVVTSIQSQSDGTEVIAHDAEINQGNSGGPLLDLCGRVIGVNTYLLRNEETNAVARFALHSRELRQFLDAQAVPASYVNTPCRPVTAQPNPAPAVTQADPAAQEPEPVTQPEAGSGAEEPATETPVDAASPEPDAPAQPEADAPGTQEPEPAAEENEARGPENNPAAAAQAATIVPPPERRISSREAGLPEGVFGDAGLASE